MFSKNFPPVAHVLRTQLNAPRSLLVNGAGAKQEFRDCLIILSIFNKVCQESFHNQSNIYFMDVSSSDTIIRIAS
jgi:hypothetical protein